MKKALLLVFVLFTGSNANAYITQSRCYATICPNNPGGVYSQEEFNAGNCFQAIVECPIAKVEPTPLPQ